MLLANTVESAARAAGRPCLCLAMNPLLDRPACPASSLRAEHIVPAVRRCRRGRDRPRTRHQRRGAGRLRRAFGRARRRHRAPEPGLGAIEHLNAVADTPDWRAAYNAALPSGEFSTRSAPTRSCAPNTARSRRADRRVPRPARRKALPTRCGDFRPVRRRTTWRDRDRFAAIQDAQAELGPTFSSMPSTRPTASPTSPASRAGRVPADTRRACAPPPPPTGARDSRSRAHAELSAGDAVRADRSLRETLYRAYATGPASWPQSSTTAR